MAVIFHSSFLIDLFFLSSLHFRFHFEGYLLISFPQCLQSGLNGLIVKGRAKDWNIFRVYRFVLLVEVVDPQANCLSEDVCDWVVDNVNSRVSCRERISEHQTLDLFSCFISLLS